MRNVFYFSKKVRLFSQNDVLFLFYFLINPAGTTGMSLKVSHSKVGTALGCEFEDHCTIQVFGKCESYKLGSVADHME